jgi:ATP-dependent Clp protease adaptor protein ClpS
MSDQASHDRASREKATATRTRPPKADRLPPFRVLLHNDDVNDIVHVIETLELLTPLNRRQAMKVTWEAHTRGLSLVTVTHKERAELYCEQLASRSLVATIEPA